MYNNKSKIFICLISTIIAYFLFIKFCLKLNPFENLQALLFNFANDYYKPHYNLFSLPTIDGINIHLYVYIFLFLYLLSISLIKLFQVKSSDSKYKTPASSILTNTVITLFFILIFQTICQVRYFAKTTNKFQNINLEQKFNIIYNIDSFKFVRFCRKHLSERYQGQLITDSDYRRTIDPYIIKYYLYPDVDFRQKSDLTKCIIVFNRENPFSVVPDNYNVIATYNPRSLLAVQKE